jgi:hypothetical protein
MSDEVFASFNGFATTATSLKQLKYMVIDRGISPDYCIYRRHFIHTATRGNKIECVAFLLEHKADVNITELPDMLTTLHVAAFYNYIHIIKLLLQYGANIESKTIAGNTPLMTAIQCNEGEAANVLINAGARIYPSKIPWIEDLRLRRIHAVRSSILAFILCCRRTLVIDKNVVKYIAQMVWATLWDPAWRTPVCRNKKECITK